MASVYDMAKAHLTHSVETLLKDASYIPADKLTWSAMGCAKSAATILAECGRSNMDIAGAIRGEAPNPSYREREQAVIQSGSMDELKRFVEESRDKMIAAIDSLSEADLGKQIKMPWGATMPTPMAVLIPASHMDYHDGQINYIQCLLGDEKFHWAE